MPNRGENCCLLYSQNKIKNWKGGAQELIEGLLSSTNYHAIKFQAFHDQLGFLSLERSLSLHDRLL